jgi:hypothetical protein
LKTTASLAMLGLLISTACKQPPKQKVANNPPGETVDRTILPIAEPKVEPITELDARNVKAPPRSK